MSRRSYARRSQNRDTAASSSSTTESADVDDDAREENGLTSSSLEVDTARMEDWTVPEPESLNPETPSEADETIGQVHDDDDGEGDDDDGDEVLPEIQEISYQEVPEIEDVPEINNNLNNNNNSSKSSPILEADSKRKSPRRKKKDKDIISVDGRRFRRVAQKGDGNCLFRSLVHALKVCIWTKSQSHHRLSSHPYHLILI